MKTLDEIGIKCKTDKNSKHMNYLNIYERYIKHLRCSHITFLEIGIYKGESIRMWDEYFSYNKTKLYAVDIDKKCKDIHKSKRVKILIGNQKDRIFLKKLTNIVKPFDIIIDDGGHTMEEQQISFGYLFRYLNSGGIYVIEDLITSHKGYKQKYYNKTNTKNTTLNMLKNLVISGKIISDFMLKSESKYIENQILSCKIEKGNNSEIAFMIKR